ncbi:MAG: DUF695 domain-containing protein [Bacteroidales bacterium]|nr:DUF695 domain-containing protein [Bacteroidales bacterium]
MKFLKNIFSQSKEETVILTYEDFWNWFQENEQSFYKAITNGNDIEGEFFDKISPKLKQLKSGIWFLAGMYTPQTAELVLTADGIAKNIVFIEELVQKSPTLENWRITALKPALDIDKVSISMAGYSFAKENLYFYANNHSEYPDEIDITVVYEHYQEKDKEAIINGVYIFLDNILGELNFVVSIDHMQIVGKQGVENELIPIEKLQDYLTWRQKEFVEKYDGIKHDTDKDNYAMLEAQLENGKPLLATVNTDLIKWDKKASHPWVLHIEMEYRGNEQGMPCKMDFELMNKIEDDIILELKDADGYLNIARQTSDGLRDVYFACKDFRLPSKVLYATQLKHNSDLKIKYDIFKDKYWKSLQHLNAEDSNDF